MYLESVLQELPGKSTNLGDGPFQAFYMTGGSELAYLLKASCQNKRQTSEAEVSPSLWFLLVQVEDASLI